MSIRSSEKRVDVPANDSDRKNEDFPTDNDGLGAAPIVAAPRVNEPEASEHVDGGLLAWLQVAGCCFLYWNSLGLINAFGAFQTFYETQLLREASASAISWIGSIQMFLLLATGPIIGPLYDAGHCRLLLYIGAFLVVFGFMMTSLCTVYWQVILAHAICVGLGAGFLTIPAIAIIPPYFKTKRAQAMTTASIGSCLGGTIYPLIFQELQPRIGFPWTVRILGFLACAMCCFSLAVLRPRHRGQRQLQSLRSLVDRTAFKSAPYCLYSVGVFFSNLAWFVPVFYIQTYALSHGMGGQPVALYLVAIMNAASIPGRILLGILSDMLGPVNTFVFITASTTIVVFSWPAVSTGAGNISFSVFYGFFSGSLVAVAPVVLTSFTKDLKVLGTRVGMVQFLKSIASLTGSPIAGAILGESRNYLGLQLFPGISFTITAAFMVALRSVLAKKESKTKI